MEKMYCVADVTVFKMAGDLWKSAEIDDTSLAQPFQLPPFCGEPRRES